MPDRFDVVVIGGGPGGYAAAIRCAQRGALVGLVEKAEMGGTCLNRGCIPSKALLGSAHSLLAAKNAAMLGIECSGISMNWGKVQSRKNMIVSGFRKGVEGLLKANKVAVYPGRGIAVEAGKVRVESEAGSEEIEAKSIILATGSSPREIPIAKLDGEVIVSSKEVLEFGEVPSSMVVIGGGVIGCELACAYAAAGTKVTIVEMLEQLLGNEDEWVSKLLVREFKKLWIDSLVSKKVSKVEAAGGGAKVTLESGEVIEAEKVLVAVGRSAVCDGETISSLGLEMKGEAPEIKGQAIKVNEKMETNVGGVYAIGDAVGTTYLAHGAFAEAEVAAVNATGGDEAIGDYSLIPRAVYTFPEVASVGKNERQCEEEGIEVEIGKALFRANGRSAAHGETSGEVRVIREKKSERILGVTIVGAIATEMIGTARALIGSSEKIMDVSFAHPSVSEVLKEAWEDAFGAGLHVPPRSAGR